MALLGEFDAGMFRMGRMMMSRQSEFIHENGLTSAQFMVLRMLMSEGPTRVSDLARSLGVKNPAASMSVQSLEEHGWVARTQDSDDHRAVLVSVTDAGVAQVERCEDSRREFMRRFTADLSAEDLEALVRILNTLTETISRDM